MKVLHVISLDVNSTVAIEAADRKCAAAVHVFLQ
jgi:hypothetical protein